MDIFCHVSHLDLHLQPDHGSATAVALVVKITDALALILIIQCKGTKPNKLSTTKTLKMLTGNVAAAEVINLRDISIRLPEFDKK